MTKTTISNVRIAGIASAIPSKTRTTLDDIKIFGKDIIRINQGLGVEKRHIAKDAQCSSDLCLKAAQLLLKKLNWNKDTINALIFVTQTPDYILPATACILQEALNLTKNCVSFDVNLGCSGYVYGLWLASNLINNNSIKRVLLLVGDTPSKITSPSDRSTATLFGDAGSATALERTKHDVPMLFELGTNGKGAKNLIVQAGSFRQPSSTDTKKMIIDSKNNLRNLEQLYMNGPEIFTFVLKDVIPLIKSLLTYANININSIDALVMHQTNLFILNHVAKSLKIDSAKLLLSLSEYGNTSSASIPLTINHHYTKHNKSLITNLLLVGFGVGYSYAACIINLDNNTVLPKIIMV